MFNQKVNHFTSENPAYLNTSLGAPAVSALDIHRCGTTIQKYTLPKSSGKNKCNGLPLQTWCSKEIAVESFAMRPIVNSKEYFQSIQKFISGIIYADSIDLKNSKLPSETYKILTDYGYEPTGSFLQVINLQVTDRVMYLMGMASDKIPMFNEYNPLGEGLVITDLDIETYKSTSNENHFYHKFIFSVVNTTRYNTISFKAEAYQDTSSMIDKWNNNIKEVKRSIDVNKDTSGGSIIYISNLNLLNTTSCVLGQENECVFKGHNLKSSFSQLLNDNFFASSKSLDWVEPDVITKDTYTTSGNYDENGNINVVDYGPDNIDELIKLLKK